MNYILYHYEYSGNKYTEKIVNFMKEKCNLVAKHGSGNWFEYTQAEKVWKPLRSIMQILTGDNHIINWGNHIFADDKYFDLNVPSAISRTSNKTKARRILQDKGVKVPQTYFFNNYQKLIDAIDVELPLIARPSHHQKGSNFIVLNSSADFFSLLKNHGNDLSDWYFSRVFEKTNEYRVHAAHGKVLAIIEKEYVHGDILSNAAVNIGHWGALNWSDFNPMICQESLKALEILGLDYAAVDVMYNAKNNSMAICELNTDPDVSAEYSAGKYASYFDWAIRHNFPQHFQIEKGTNIFYSQMLRD